MKVFKYLIFLVIPLFGSKCEKEGDKCHYFIEITNSSTSPVIFGQKGTNAGNCILTGNILKPKENATRDLRYCWEDELSKGKTFDFYIVDPVKFNESGKFYDCDSIPIKNKILKEYKLSLMDLQKVDFKISYP